MIADRRSQKVLRSSAIIWKHTSAIVCDRLRSCDHMETKVLRSAIETYPIIFLILTHDSTLLSRKALMWEHLFTTWLAWNMVTLLTRSLWRKLRDMSAFTTEIARISKTKTKRITVGKKVPSSCLFINIFRIQNRCFLRFWGWRCRRFRTKRRNKFACSKSSSSMSAMLFTSISSTRTYM